MNITLFQPDMAANAAAAIRLAACLGVPVWMIEPCGFVWDERRLRRVGMDYLDQVDLRRWPSWEAFERRRRADGKRLILLTTKASTPYHLIDYRHGDILLGGSESAGVPDDVHAASDLRVSVPMAPNARSLNLVTSLAIVIGEALRQTDGFPKPADC
ncbi:MAG: tRNA (cytidine(34)-2'-O)-methyltransferase [Geminicoccaceae bacterium]